MNKNVLIALIAGLVGGVATRYITPTPVFAQNTPTNEIRAEHFTLVDASDRTIGTFSTEHTSSRVLRFNRARPGEPAIDVSPMRIVLRDANGRELWSAEPADGNPVRPLTWK